MDIWQINKIKKNYMENMKSYEEFNWQNSKNKMKEKMIDLSDTVGSFLNGTVTKKSRRIENDKQNKVRNIIKLIKQDGYDLLDVSGIITDGSDMWIYKIFDFLNYGEHKKNIIREVDPYGEEDWENDEVEIHVCISPRCEFLKGESIKIVVHLEPMSVIRANRLYNLEADLTSLDNMKIIINFNQSDSDIKIKDEVIQSIDKLIKNAKKFIIDR